MLNLLSFPPDLLIKSPYFYYILSIINWVYLFLLIILIYVYFSAYLIVTTAYVWQSFSYYYSNAITGSKSFSAK